MLISSYVRATSPTWGITLIPFIPFIPPLQPPFKFDLRSDTTVYLTPAADRCVVVFAIDFTEDTDNVIARIFLQEFVETRRHLGASPPVAFSKEPPLELKHFGLTESNNRLGYVSFAIMKNHVDRGRRDQVVKALPMFRNYLQYHSRCCDFTTMCGTLH
jgi:actin related protein 2/3 complex subunit 2